MSGDYQLESRIRSGVMNELRDPDVDVHSISCSQLAENLYFVQMYLWGGQVRLRCLAVDTGVECIIFFSADFIRQWVLQPALESYTREHPWIAGL
jgi:hypothetical protein